MDYFKNIFHPSDFSTGDEVAWIHALRIAIACQSKLSLLHVSPTKDGLHWSQFPHIRPTLEQWGLLEQDAPREAVENATGIHFRKVRLVGSDPVKTITGFLEKRKQDLIVLSTHQRQGFSRWISDTEAEPIARAVKANTLFVPRRSMGFVSVDSGRLRLRKILIPIAKEPNPQQSIYAAAQLATALGCPETSITCLHVGSSDTAPRIPKELASHHKIQGIAVKGNIVDEILIEAESGYYDLIVMSTDGHKGFLDTLRGTTTERVIRGAHCPVLAINEC